MSDKVLIDRAALEQPKPSAKYSDVVSDGGMDPRNTALEQPQVEPEPVAFIRDRVGDDFSVRLHRVVTAEDFAGNTEKFLSWCQSNAEHGWKPLYTHPQPHRQPLTFTQLLDVVRPIWNDGDCTLEQLIRAIERAHGIGGEL